MKKTTLLCYAMIFSSIISIAQTLGAGDIAFIGFNTDNPDGFSFITLKEIPSGEVIYFTDEGWNDITNTWVGNSEDHLTFTATGTISCGTIISIVETSADTFTVTGPGSISITGYSGWSLLGGDQVLAYYSASGPEPGTVPTFIAGIHGDDGTGARPINPSTGWNDYTGNSGDTGTQFSAVPAGLTNGTNCISLSPSSAEQDNARYNGTLTGNSASLLTLINDRTEWVFDDSTGYDITPTGYATPSVTCPLANSAPTATAPSAPTVLEDATNVALADNVQVADTDGDDQTVTFAVTGGTVTLGTAGISFGGSGNGSASFTAAGTLANINAALDAATFTPTPNLNGTNAGTISFTTNDGTDTSSPASVTFDITAVNDEPSFTAGANETINEDAGAQIVNGWATAIDDGDADVTQTLTFTVTNDNNALFSVQPAINAMGNLTYTPATNANGSATVDVVLSDNGGTANGGDDTFATQQFTITVNAVNDEPSFTAGANETINEDAGAQTVNGWATAIDDGDADATQTLTFTVTNDNNALFSVQPAINAMGNLTYTPATNANGSATVDVVLSDNGGTANGGDDTFATQQFTITVNAVNDEPSFTAGANETINEDAGAQTVNGWATAIDDGDADATQTLTFTVTNDSNALFSTQPAVDAMGNLTYTPATNANGSATVDAVLSDNGGTANGGDDTFATQQFTITINAVNDEPSFTAGANESINEDAGAQTVNGWATAIDDGDAEATQTLTFTVTNDNNALFSAQPAIDATGNLTYTPAANANGSATVSVVLSDDGGTANGGDDTFATQQFTITVNAINDEPSFTAGANETINEDAGAQTVNGWATAIDDGDSDAAQTLTFTVTNDNNALFSAQPAIDATGNLTYTPAANANGSATVSVVLSDNGGTANGGDDTFATQQFTITINAVNDEPSFTAGANETINEDAGAQTVNGWAIAIDDGDSDAAQTLTFTVTNDNNALFSAQPAIDATGNLTYTPATNANGSATVDVVLSDDGGTANGGDDTFATQQFTITVNAVNDEPSFTAGANETINEDAGAQTVNGWATAIDDGDADATQTLTFTVTNDNNALFSAQPAIDATGNLTYTPAADANGTATVDVVLSDDGGTANGGDDTFATQQFTITINAVNDEPSFTPGANETVNEDAGAQTVNGWATAIDDGDSEAMQTLTFTVTNDNNALFSIQPAIDVSGNLTYTPAASATGAAIVDVILSDNGGTANGGDDTFATQQFTITVSDITPPMVSITSSEPNPTNNSSFEITINFNEDITGFDISDIIVGNGTAANLSGGGLSYTATITATTPGTITVDINANSVNDLSGNGNIAATQFSIIYDNLLDVNDETLANGLTVYPTPSNNIINITGAIDLDIERTEIFDIRGKLILSQKLDPSSIINTIDISSIPSGLYLMRIYSKTSSTMKRVVKK